MSNDATPEQIAEILALAEADRERKRAAAYNGPVDHRYGVNSADPPPALYLIDDDEEPPPDIDDHHPGEWAGEHDKPAAHAGSPTTWEPVDLGPWLRGEIKQPQPCLGVQCLAHRFPVLAAQPVEFALPFVAVGSGPGGLLAAGARAVSGVSPRGDELLLAHHATLACHTS
jgi:hypothetical protein